MLSNFNFQGLKEFHSVYLQETAMTAQTEEELLAALLEQQKIDVSLFSLSLSLFSFLIYTWLIVYYLNKFFLF